MILYSSTTSQKFKIGSLLPELHVDYSPLLSSSNELIQQSTQCKVSSIRKEIAIWNAIWFANKEMARLFRDSYSCDISLSQAETHVVNLFYYIFFTIFYFKVHF